MKCPSCGSHNADTAKSCNLCSKVFTAPVVAQDAVKETVQDDKLAELRREYAARTAEQARQTRERRRYKMRDHGITGIITFFILNTLAGLPGSLLHWNLVINAVLSAIFGFPVGYLISRWGGGVARGVLISAGFFTVLLLITSAPSVLRGNLTLNVFGLWIGLTLLRGLIMGIIPGAIIGYHVKLSEGG
ncbi:MAG: zinc ribbon domain-containing protein [Planctomycetota bacterium]